MYEDMIKQLIEETYTFTPPSLKRAKELETMAASSGDYLIALKLRQAAEYEREQANRRKK